MVMLLVILINLKLYVYLKNFFMKRLVKMKMEILLGIFIVFMIIKAIFGLRVSEEEEIEGLDPTEHGLASAYSGFSIMDISNTMTMEVNENTSLGTDEYESASTAAKEAAVRVVVQAVAAVRVVVRAVAAPHLLSRGARRLPRPEYRRSAPRCV